MPVIMLVFVNYACFSKKCGNFASAFYLNNFGQNTSITKQQASKWQTNLSWLHLETLLVNNSL